MKLLFCTSCRDIFALLHGVERKCFCKEAGGLYIDQINVEVSGPAYIICMKNSEVMQAMAEAKINKRDSNGQAPDYVWWMLNDHERIKRKYPRPVRNGYSRTPGPLPG